MLEQSVLQLKPFGEHGKDIFLCHTGADKPWVEKLAERIEAQPYQTRFLGVVFDKWDFEKGGNIVIDIEREIDACRFVGLVVTRAMLAAAWPTMERSIAVWSDPSGTKGRVIPLLRENVTLPASLRIRNWIDFRDDGRFEDAFAELVRVLRGEKTPRGRGSLLPTVPETKPPYDPAPVVITSSVGADRIEERLLSNLLPVVELPQTVFSAETPLRSKADIHEYSDKVSHPAFVLREGRLWTFVNLRENTDSFGTSIQPTTIRENGFESWFSDADHARWAVELLNVCLKEYEWHRYLRLDKDRHRYFFAPYEDRPKKISWNIGGKWCKREVTARHMVTRKLPDGSKEKIQSGWRHQACRAGFVLMPFGLFLRLEPTWMLTKADGKTPRGGSRVGPILSHWLNQERNGQILRSVRFWSLVFARGKSEVLILTGQKPIRISLTPACGDLEFGILADQIDYDGLMRAEMEDDIELPQLGFTFNEFVTIEDDATNTQHQ
jgi:TIR domain